MKITITHIILVLLLSICTASAQEYYLLQTVIGTGGGSYATSSGYKMNSTIGASDNGHNSSSGYTGEGGFWGEHDALGQFFNSAYSVIDGWNLLSIGKVTTDYRATTLFPTASSKAFAYHQGYVSRDTMRNAEGYWLKFSGGELVNVPGISLAHDTIPVIAGWNIIGSVGSPVNVGAVTQIPGGIVTSSYFGYNGAYQIATSINPGNGYWVKCTAPGELVLTASAIAPGAIAAQQSGEGSSELNVLTVTPKAECANHPSQTLMFASSVPAGKTPDAYVMPPAAPGGLDARFTTNRYAEFFSGGENAPKEIPLSIHSDGALVTLSWTLNERGGQRYVLVEKQGEKILAEHRLTNNSKVTLADIEKKTFSLKLESMPVTYALAQNYPNPFNPTTAIRYQLPFTSRVMVKVYDMLGREVSTLVDGEQEVGYQSVEWSAANFASGVYFYRMTARQTDGSPDGRAGGQAGTFSEVKKMMLIR